MRHTLPHTATKYNTLQHPSLHCITLHQTATRSVSTPCDHTATHCNTLQHTATHCNTLQHTATHCNTLQHTATHCNTFQTAARSVSTSNAYKCIYKCTTMNCTRKHLVGHTPQHVMSYATHCSTQKESTSCMLQQIAIHCNTLQCTATSELHNSIHHATRCNILQHNIKLCNTLQHRMQTLVQHKCNTL